MAENKKDKLDRILGILLFIVTAYWVIGLIFLGINNFLIK